MGFSPGAATLATTLLVAAPVRAELSAEELAKLAQNPVGNLISVPFQNNTNYNVGPLNGNQNILNIQPVIPIEISPEWNIITRTIVPVISQPKLSQDSERKNGIGDTAFTAFLSPAKPGHWIWGVGPIVQIPTNTSDELGNKNWGLGPSFVVLHLDHGSPWVYGVLLNNVWSLSSSKQGGSYNNGLIQPFVNYNFKGGLYLTSAPIATVDWKADSGQRVDGAARRRHRQDLPPRQAAGEHAAVRLLQRGAPGQRRQLAAACAGAVHVSEVEAAEHQRKKQLHGVQSADFILAEPRVLPGSLAAIHLSAVCLSPRESVGPYLGNC